MRGPAEGHHCHQRALLLTTDRCSRHLVVVFTVVGDLCAAFSLMLVIYRKTKYKCHCELGRNLTW